MLQKFLFNLLTLCSLRLEWLNKLLLNHRGNRVASAPLRFPDFPAGILLRAASPLLPKGEASAKGEATGAAQQRKTEILRVTLKGLVPSTQYPLPSPQSFQG
ncbi:hypothetical protein [Nostoc sp.]|uniref:hypothetical protein n=1 Tax=Nostoc sp. TaxID=1180 RepID=UPI002FF8935F